MLSNTCVGSAAPPHIHHYYIELKTVLFLRSVNHFVVCQLDYKTIINDKLPTYSTNPPPPLQPQIILRAYADGCWRIDLIITGALHTFIVYFCSKWQIDCPSVLIYNKRYINNSHLYSAINLLAMHSRDPTPLFVCVHARCLIVSLKDHDRQHGDSCCSAPPSVWRAAEIGGKPHLPATSASTHAYLSYYSQPHGRARAHTHAHARVLMTSILCVRMRVISAVMLTICWRFVEMQAKCTA